MPASSLAILVVDVSVVCSCVLDSHLTNFILEHCVDQAFSYVFPSRRMFLVVGACLQHNLVHFAHSSQERMQSCYKCKSLGHQHTF